MELRNLRTFLAAADRGSYQRAAEALGYTQSTVTVQIRQLEEELGVPLFQREGRRMALTEAGRQALPQARELLAGRSGWPPASGRSRPPRAPSGWTWARPCCATCSSR